MPPDSVWQPAKNRSAVAKKTDFARKIDIFQDRHLLSSTTRAIPRFFLHRTALSVKFEARCWNWKFTPPVLAIWRKIGRASCRERAERSGGDGMVTRKRGASNCPQHSQKQLTVDCSNIS